MDVVANHGALSVGAECKGGIVNTKHPGRVSQLRRGLCEAVGLLLTKELDPDQRQFAVVPRTAAAEGLAGRLAARAANAGISINGRLSGADRMRPPSRLCRKETRCGKDRKVAPRQRPILAVSPHAAHRLCPRLEERRITDPQARRLLALAAIYDGASRTKAATIGGVTLQVVRDWHHRRPR